MVRNLFILNLKCILRDRVLQALVAVSILLLFLVPAFSAFSLRQVQEVSITLSLSFISLMLFILATFLGATSVWRDIERRYAVSVLTLPGSRGKYLTAKFMAISFFLLVCAAFLGIFAAAAIKIGALMHPSQLPVRWGYIAFALVADACKYILLTALAILFSTLSTSFFLPFFGTASLFIAGNASQEVYDYVTGEAATRISPVSLAVFKGVYYILPNFGAFNFKVHAVYPVPLPQGGLMISFLYFFVYLILVLSLAASIFSRRELP